MGWPDDHAERGDRHDPVRGGGRAMTAPAARILSGTPRLTFSPPIRTTPPPPGSKPEMLRASKRGILQKMADSKRKSISTFREIRAAEPGCQKVKGDLG